MTLPLGLSSEQEKVKEEDTRKYTRPLKEELCAPLFSSYQHLFSAFINYPVKISNLQVIVSSLPIASPLTTTLSATKPFRSFSTMFVNRFLLALTVVSASVLAAPQLRDYDTPEYNATTTNMISITDAEAINSVLSVV